MKKLILAALTLLTVPVVYLAADNPTPEPVKSTVTQSQPDTVAPNPTSVVTQEEPPVSSTQTAPLVPEEPTPEKEWIITDYTNTLSTKDRECLVQYLAKNNYLTLHQEKLKDEAFITGLLDKIKEPQCWELET